tara:strand:+ start:109 stop:411 length:303 start_codon:yes stop_codon:yes gene_type:complete
MVVRAPGKTDVLAVEVEETNRVENVEADKNTVIRVLGAALEGNIPSVKKELSAEDALVVTVRDIVPATIVEQLGALDAQDAQGQDKLHARYVAEKERSNV